MRKPHELVATTGNQRPTRIVFFDTETHQTIHKKGGTRHHLRLGHAVFCVSQPGEYLKVRERLDFKTSWEFVSWIDKIVSDKYTVYLVAHNLNFDLPILHFFKHLPHFNFKLQSMYTKDLVGIYRWKDEQRRIIALDNGNFFQGKLELLGQEVNLDKKKVDWDDPYETILDYCKRDVDIIVELWREWLKFLDIHQLGSFKQTLSATAFNAFRHRFMKHRVYIHNEKPVIELERASYKGGRVECFYQGFRDDDTFYQLDVNSMYPYVMRDNLFPISLERYYPYPSINGLYNKLTSRAVVADVTIRCDRAYFPYRYKGHTCYPIGEFRTVLTTPELKLCYENNWIRDVHSYASYLQAPLFSEYINYIYPLKAKYSEEGNELYYRIAKLLGNGLYGKFGQLGTEEKVVGETLPHFAFMIPGHDIKTRKRYDFIFLGGQIIQRFYGGEAYHSFCAVASHVTAYARMYLSELRDIAGIEHVFYMDTDSLLCGTHGFLNLQSYCDPYELGKLKLELKADWIRINAPKDYQFAGKLKRKGIRNDAVQINDNTWQQDQWPKIQGMLRRNDMNEYVVKPVKKTLARQIHSGVPLRTGWVAPFHLRPQYPLFERLAHVAASYL